MCERDTTRCKICNLYFLIFKNYVKKALPELEREIQLDSYVGSGKSLGHQTRARTLARLAF